MKGEKAIKKRHHAEEIIRILRDIEQSASVEAGVRRHNITEQTYYRWKRKYGAMSTEEAKRLKESVHAEIDQDLALPGHSAA